MICRNVGQASELLSVLANPNRLAIVCLLLEGERSVRALEITLGINQPTLSQQLGVLREAGVIEARRAARHVFYRVVDERAGRVVETLRGIFSELLPASILLAPAESGADLAAAIAAVRLAEREMMS